MNLQVVAQKKLFETLSKRKYDNSNVLFDVMEALNIKKGAAYKRMNGETALTLEEVLKLADHFQVSLDTIFRNDKYISFFHPFISGETDKRETSEEFFDQFTYFLKPLETNHREEEKELTYLANELPIFYYFSHKYIFTFLLNVWNHLHWSDGQINITDTNVYDAKIEHLRKDLAKYYYGHPVTEVWNSNMLNNLYQQIIFCITIRGFKDPSFVKRLVNDVESLIKHLRDVAITGIQSIKGVEAKESELKIYLNDFGNYLNLVLYKSKYINSSFIGYDYPHFIVSHNQNFWKFSQEWVDKIKKRSVLISSEGYQYRELFFIKMEDDFEQFKDRVDKLMNVYYS